MEEKEKNDYLAHYGVLGMKWGRRKGRSAKKSKISTRGASEDYQRAKKIRKKSIAQMSNGELETVIKRMQLEKQYKDLKKNQVDSGKKIAKEILDYANTANNIYEISTKPGTKAVARLISNRLKKK